MPEVRIGSEIKTYPQGTAYAEIAEEYQKNYENDILLVSVNGRLRELHKTLQKDCQMEFITAADTAGYLAYQRSAVFLMMKAFQDVAGRENVKNITVCFSVENGLYVEVEGGVTLSQELLDRVKAEMKRLSEQDLPLQKRSENTDEAMDHFQDQVVHAPPRDRIVECSHVKHTELVTELFRLLLDIKQFFLRMERLNRLRLLLVRQTQDKSFLVHL